MTAVEGINGIDFNNPGTDKPANLANSAVLRMLEEEERNRRGYPSQKKVVWPPVPETNGYHQPQQQNTAYNAQYSPSAQPQQQQYQQPQYQQSQYQQPQQQQQQQQAHYQQPQYQQSQNQHQYQQQAPQSQPGYCEGRRQESTGLSKLIPVGPGVTAGPTPQSPYRQGPASPGIAPQPYRQQSSRWAPVPAPLSPQTHGTQPNYQQQQYSQSQYSPSQYSPQPQYSPSYSEPAYQQPQKQFEPPPSTITLRPKQPVHQQPPPVFPSQPATASFKGGVNMRGDMKWPPQSVKEAVAAENEARVQLAKGPACRPRKVKKDYTQFFAKNALNHNYPGYRVPPGTQYYEDHSGRSSY